MPPKKPTIEEIIAKTVAAQQQAQPKPEKRPFFSPKSPGLWASIGAVIVYAFTIFGNINGCFQSKYDKEQKINSAYDGVNRLDHGDSIILRQISQNYWYFVGLHKQDSAYAAIWQDHFMDSLSDHRWVIDRKKNK